MIKRASDHGRVVLILNSDEWLIRKKGYVFMPFDERKQLLEAIVYVDMVIGVDDSDGTVCKALAMLQPDYFGNGGDREEKNTPEISTCIEYDIQLVYGLGDKIQSSSDLVTASKEKKMQEVPNDAIILSPDEARAVFNEIESLEAICTSNQDLLDAIQTLDEQLEEDNTES